ncbi:hypothetical protein LEP1GSC062_0282 [Leptospira alexanderi serovar Manhao 3 str. L 60]|uniref:Uncharacterized protein n=1 Tax=Leptospira alexanderi serovar Manhao 3 str. L 60 TaxID=1049759 RepID=V6I5A0_9LEPT|nr:hypothetical protein LEP1GSC062_0282 [Leptospira alexanderi serovar Manhao 3 str. L 60]
MFRKINAAKCNNGHTNTKIISILNVLLLTPAGIRRAP